MSMLEVLLLAYLDFFRNNLAIVFNLDIEFILKVICSLHYFSPKSIKKTAIYKYQVFYCDNSVPSLFSQPISLVHIWGHIFYYNIYFLQKNKNLIHMDWLLLSAKRIFMWYLDLIFILES